MSLIARHTQCSTSTDVVRALTEHIEATRALRVYREASQRSLAKRVAVTSLFIDTGSEQRHEVGRALKFMKRL